MLEQSLLLELPEQAERAIAPTPQQTPKLVSINRAQDTWVALVVDDLIGQDHKARLIWELTGTMDLSGFAAGIRSSEGSAGRPTWEPRLMVSVWLYTYCRGISSAREIAREMEYEPGLRWLTGLQLINHQA